MVRLEVKEELKANPRRTCPQALLAEEQLVTEAWGWVEGDGESVFRGNRASPGE